MKKKIILILGSALSLALASEAVVVQSTTTTTTTQTETQPEEIGISTYEVSEAPMSVGEAAWTLSRAVAVVAMDMDSSTTVTEQSFALSSLIYKVDKAVALNTFKELFNSAPTIEARVYALIGIYALADTSEFNAFYDFVNKDDTLLAIVSGKTYTVTIEKFFATFKKNPQMFLPTSFPPKNLSFEKAASDSSSTNSTTTSTVKTTTTSVSFSTFPAVWYPDIAFWNPFPRPIIIFSHHKRPPHFTPRPLPPRPLPPRPLPPRPRPIPASPPPAFKPNPIVHKPSTANSARPKVVYKKPTSSPVGKPKFGSSAKGVKDRAPRSGGLTNLDLNSRVNRQSSARPAPSTTFNRSTPQVTKPSVSKTPPPAVSTRTPAPQQSRVAVPTRTQQTPKAMHQQRQGRK